MASPWSRAKRYWEFKAVYLKEIFGQEGRLYSYANKDFKKKKKILWSILWIV